MFALSTTSDVFACGYDEIKGRKRSREGFSDEVLSLRKSMP